MPQPLLRKEEEEEENRQSKDGLLVTGLHQQSLESCLTGMSSTDHVAVGRESRSTPERVQSENSFEEVGQDILTTRK